ADLLRHVTAAARPHAVSREPRQLRCPGPRPQGDDPLHAARALLRGDRLEREAVPEGRVKLVAIGASYGGLYALMDLLGALPKDFPCPLAVVQHRSAGEHDEHRLGLVLSRYSALPVHDADHGQTPEPSRVYLAPAHYHLLIDEGRLELTVDEFVHYSLPSIVVLFYSAVRALVPEVVGLR